MRVNVANLGRWLCSWVTDMGEINGFHNHSVWGTNPYRYNDMTSTHTTFASPLMPALAKALSVKMDKRGLSLLQKLIKYQTSSYLDDNQFAHIGFQVGESAVRGLIHNMVPCISLLQTVCVANDFLDDTYKNIIKKSVLKVMEACLRYGGGRAGDKACCNQDYARIWAKLLFFRAFNESPWKEEVYEDLNYMCENFHIAGIPDDECEGTCRVVTEKISDECTIEPAEYYGLMIMPLILGYEDTKNEKYLDTALKLCRHIIRSSWIDENGRTRFHRMWYIKNGKKYKSNEPMLIAGMGITLFAIRKCFEITNDKELSEFLNKMNDTYSFYQTKAGYFLSATGWDSEVDVAPCSAWHSHDFMYLIEVSHIDDDFWNVVFSKDEYMSVLLGNQCFYAEFNGHWGIFDYEAQGLYGLHGIKKIGNFEKEYDAWSEKKPVSSIIKFENRPHFIKLNDGIFLCSDVKEKINVENYSKFSYKGLL